MTDTVTQDTTTEEAEERTQGTPEQRDDAVQRARSCSDEIAAVLKKYRCEIIAYLGEPEFVGDREKLLVAARYGIVPQP